MYRFLLLGLLAITAGCTFHVECVTSPPTMEALVDSGTEVTPDEDGSAANTNDALVPLPDAAVRTDAPPPTPDLIPVPCGMAYGDPCCFPDGGGLGTCDPGLICGQVWGHCALP